MYPSINTKSPLIKPTGISALAPQIEKLKFMEEDLQDSSQLMQNWWRYRRTI
jgi:hypothetical protein